MGKVIALRARAYDARREPPTGSGAQILFFTGVRYMRMEDLRMEDLRMEDLRMEETPAAAPNERDSGAGGGRKRKRRARA